MLFIALPRLSDSFSASFTGSTSAFSSVSEAFSALSDIELSSVFPTSSAGFSTFCTAFSTLCVTVFSTALPTFSTGFTALSAAFSTLSVSAFSAVSPTLSHCDCMLFCKAESCLSSSASIISDRLIVPTDAPFPSAIYSPPPNAFFIIISRAVISLCICFGVFSASCFFALNAAHSRRMRFSYGEKCLSISLLSSLRIRTVWPSGVSFIMPDTRLSQSE